MFTKVEDALKLSREIPGSRFNKFSSRSEAEAFCCLTNEPNRIIAKVKCSSDVTISLPKL